MRGQVLLQKCPVLLSQPGAVQGLCAGPLGFVKPLQLPVQEPELLQTPNRLEPQVGLGTFLGQYTSAFLCQPHRSRPLQQQKPLIRGPQRRQGVRGLGRGLRPR